MWCKISSFRALLRNSEGKIEISFFHCMTWFQGTKVPQKIRVGGGARRFEKNQYFTRLGCPVHAAGGLVIDSDAGCCQWLKSCLCPVMFRRCVQSSTSSRDENRKYQENNANYSNLLLLVDFKIHLSTWAKKFLTFDRSIWEALGECLVLFFNSLGLFLIPINQYIYSSSL